MMEARDVRRERIFVCIFLLAVCLTLAYFVRGAWSAGEGPTGRSDQPAAVLYAPDAYRVAMPALADVLQRVYAGDRPSMSALCDFCFFFDTADKLAADYTLVNKIHTLAEFSFGIPLGHSCTGTCTTGRPVNGFLAIKNGIAGGSFG